MGDNEEVREKARSWGRKNLSDNEEAREEARSWGHKNAKLDVWDNKNVQNHDLKYKGSLT